MKHLYFIRHGQNPYGLHDQYCGSSNPFLTPEGIEDLRRLKALGGYPDIRNVHVYTSGWTRAEQTLRELYGEVPHDIDMEFRECNYGDLEGMTRIGMYGKPGFRPWWGGPDDDIPYPNGESWQHVFQRVQAEVKRLQTKDEDALIVCHAGPVAAVMCSLFPQERASVEKWLLQNGHGYGIDFENKTAVRWYDIPRPQPRPDGKKKA